MKRILVTGASGLVGRAFVGAMPRDVELVTLGRHLPSPTAENVQIVRHDLCNSELPALPTDIDTIVHLAQERDYRCFPEKAASTFAVNTSATLQLLDWGRKVGVRRFVLASTGGLYARSEGPVTEQSEVEISGGPLSFYFGTKYAAETLAQNFQGLMTVAVLRFFFVYGSGQASSMLFPRLIASVREGRPIQLTGNEGLTFNPIHAFDAGAAVAAATTLEESLLVNIGGPEVVTLRTLGEKIGSILGRDARFEEGVDTGAPSMIADISTMRRHLRSPAINIAEGLAEAIHGPKVRPSIV